ncbi:hypothetical protein N8E89_03130 [Phyllobacterium sp. A18/5-2]|uniref:hypothetical protein n=1 Tax=Phyllobacterium sp. A18/5-2 TaxID=2978392 RepID=UPI0021C748C2|nr:hypothetical protein [Phyllobacterium sp. A18/5-2]UXN65991.1 hypothetical protein N8E89_03130 [Phyllobacterium sp. A18/5-2]
MLDADIVGQAFFELGYFRSENILAFAHDFSDRRIEFAANPFTLCAEIDELHHCSNIKCRRESAADNGQASSLKWQLEVCQRPPFKVCLIL